MGRNDETFIHIPFPDGFYQEDTSFELLIDLLNDRGIQPEKIAGMITESFDEVQSRFGRTGRLFGYEHYNVTPHSGSPICVAAALANLRELKRGNYLENSRELGLVLRKRLNKIHSDYPEVCAHVSSRGLVGGILIVKPGTKEPDNETAVKINTSCFEKGLLMFAPVGKAGECIKIAPLFCITREALDESLDVLEESISPRCLGPSHDEKPMFLVEKIQKESSFTIEKEDVMVFGVPYLFRDKGSCLQSDGADGG